MCIGYRGWFTEELAVLGNMMVEANWITSDNIGQLVGFNLAEYLAGPYIRQE